MLRQHKPGTKYFKTNWAKAGIKAAIGLCFLCVPPTLAQRSGTKANAMPASSNPILSAQIAVSDGSMIESGIQPKAMRMYSRAAQELHGGQAASAEKDALHAVWLDAKFADAEAQAATAALVRQKFSRARSEADDAVHIDANDEKAWVVLATADNYLAEYDDAIDALRHVREAHWTTWQVAYQWARAEAGQKNAAQTLEWANRAALTAPSGFAPLHLLRASALLAAGRYSQSADELETYLQLLGKDAPEREELTRELHRLRESPRNSGTSQTAASGVPGYNALAN